MREDSALAEKETVTPEDLMGIPLISTVSPLLESNIGKWFGEYAGQMNVVAKGNLLYNEAMMAESSIGAVIGIQLNCHYDQLRFVPLSPSLESTTALVWKKEQSIPAAASAFIEFAKQYLKGITDNAI